MKFVGFLSDWRGGIYDSCNYKYPSDKNRLEIITLEMTSHDDQFDIYSIKRVQTYRKLSLTSTISKPYCPQRLPSSTKITMARFQVAFGTLAFLAVFTLINACVPTGTNIAKRTIRELRTESLGKGIGLDFVLRSRNVKTMTARDSKQTEEVFLEMDSNNDGVVDACEWTSFSDETTVREFIKLLDFADLDDNEAVSLEELLSALKS